MRLASIFISGAGLFFVGCSSKQKVNLENINPLIQLSEDNSDVIVSGISGLEIRHTDLNVLLSVFVLEEGQSWNRNDTPISGNYVIKQDRIVFTPNYPFLETTQYYARFDLSEFSNTKETNLITGYTFSISKDKTPVTFVKDVYPTTNLIPRNLLKFYVEFSGSMTEGNMLDHVRIIDDKGEVVEHAFLEIPQELWDVNRQRLTILFDPGRIKRGMDLLNETGAPFKIGKNYSLQIDKDWNDGQNRDLTASFTKEFTVVEDDRTQPKTENWSLSIPEYGTKSPLLIRFNESLDFALLTRTISVLVEQNQVVSGQIRLSQEEKVWEFTPDSSWQNGSYTIRVQTILEDLAGNNLISLFDVDLNNQQEAVNRKETKELTMLSFKID